MERTSTRLSALLRAVECRKGDLPMVLRDIVMMKRGLVIMIGGTGQGKSTSLAAMG